jgi:archaetidylinositol phosphate synthase
MAAGPPAYKVEDRSILLPYYRRWLVDPILPHLPASLNPNTITHAGHVLNLAGTALLITIWPRSGWPFVVATILLQLYLWCDNADGAHARRTGQCSAYGEYLDHGLDGVNTVYIAYLTAMALGAPPLWWVVIVLLIPGGAAAAYWEQSQTGVFRLGMLNQIESLTVLSIALMTSAIFGTQVWEQVAVGGITLRLAILTWSLATLAFGIVRGMMRVAKDDLGAVVPVLALIVFGSCIAGAAAVEAISTVAAVIIATAVNVYFALRMLALRLRKTSPKLDMTMVLGSLMLGGLIAWKLSGGPVSPHAGSALATLACAVFGGQAVLDARDGLQRLVRMEQSSSTVALK